MFSKKKSFKEVKKPVGDESCFLFDDEESERKVKAKNSRLRVKRKPMVKTMSIIDYFDEENEDEYLE